VKCESVAVPVLPVNGQEAGEMMAGVSEAGVQSASRFILPESMWNRDDDRLRIHQGYMASRDRFCTYKSVWPRGSLERLRPVHPIQL
jgi:hypothetical protein